MFDLDGLAFLKAETVLQDAGVNVAESFDAGVAHATPQWVRISKSGYPKCSGMYRVTLSDGTLGQSAFYFGRFDGDVIGWLPKVKIEPMPLLSEGGENQ